MIKKNRTILKENEFFRGLYITLSIDKFRDYKYALLGIKEALMEQKVEQNKEMVKWNESSVNTIRYYSTIDNNGHYSVLPHALRTGRVGCVVDNACCGGVFAAVNPETGVVYTEGIDRKAECFDKHPDSGISFIGWQIPRWEELCSIVKEAHEHYLPNHYYIGWDWALTDDGWVLIEANWGQMIQ